MYRETEKTTSECPMCDGTGRRSDMVYSSYWGGGEDMPCNVRECEYCRGTGRSRD